MISSDGRATRRGQDGGFTRSDPADRGAFDAHYRRIRSDPDVTIQAIEDDGDLSG